MANKYSKKELDKSMQDLFSSLIKQDDLILQKKLDKIPDELIEVLRYIATNYMETGIDTDMLEKFDDMDIIIPVH